MKKEPPKIRKEEMWMMRREWTHQFVGLEEARAKVTEVGKIDEVCEDGVKFHFLNSEDEYFLARQEFTEKFEKVY